MSLFLNHKPSTALTSYPLNQEIFQFQFTFSICILNLGAFTMQIPYAFPCRPCILYPTKIFHFFTFSLIHFTICYGFLSAHHDSSSLYQKHLVDMWGCFKEPHMSTCCIFMFYLYFFSFWYTLYLGVHSCLLFRYPLESDCYDLSSEKLEDSMVFEVEDSLPDFNLSYF